MNYIEHAPVFGFMPLSAEILIVLLSFFTGAVMMLIYTLYSWCVARRIPRKCLKRKLILGVLDVLFWTAAAFCVFLMYYKLTEGSVRLFYYAFILSGMITAYNVKLKIIRRRH